MSNSTLTAAQPTEAVFQFRNNANFGSLEHAALSLSLKSVRLLAGKDGESVIRQDDAGVSVFLLQSGQIKLMWVFVAGNEKLIKLIGPGHTLFCGGGDFRENDVYLVSALVLRLMMPGPEVSMLVDYSGLLHCRE